MTSFLSSIAATGGSAGARLAAAAAAAGAAGGVAAPSGYSSDGFLAGKERRAEGGSAYDGWSEGDDLALLVGGDEPAAAAPAPALLVSAGVQTAPVAEEELAHAAAAAAAAAAAGGPLPDSPDSFVLADSHALFDEAAAAEYEAVPGQRTSGTQTQPHLLATTAARGAAGIRPRRGSRVPGPGAASAAVGVDGCLADIQAAFGGGAKPALHAQLGGCPLGPTHLYAYRGAVFEVLRSGAIATVTLFEA